MGLSWNWIQFEFQTELFSNRLSEHYPWGNLDADQAINETFFRQMMANRNPQLKVESVRDKRGISRKLGRIAFNLFAP